MINTSKLSKALTFCLVYNVLIILTVICNYTLAAVGNNPGDRGDALDSNQDGFQTNKIVGKNNPELSLIDITKIDTTKANDINKSIQIGIEYAIKSIYKKPQYGLSPTDYTDFEDSGFDDWVDTSVSPAQLYNNFIFTTYGPKAFRHFRKLFAISQEDYVDSFCNTSLRSIPNPGASASIFYFTRDDKFIMKSVHSTEFRIFQKMLNKYKDHVEENPASLLPKFSGLYGYQDYRTDIELVSMNNILPSNIKIHLKYDLKGSTYNRKASTDERQKRNPTFKDLDFTQDIQDGIFLMPYTLSGFLQTIDSDCNFLRTFNIMDYSLLMGIHKIDEDMSSTCSRAASARWNRLMVDSIGMASIQDDTGTFADEDCPLLKGSIPAQNISGERLLLFVGIIDILQEYRITKKIEHHLKVIIQNKNVSVQDPDFYATRFLIFLNESVFKLLLSPEERKNQSVKQTIESKSRKRSFDESTENAFQNCFK